MDKILPNKTGAAGCINKHCNKDKARKL